MNHRKRARNTITRTAVDGNPRPPGRSPYVRGGRALALARALRVVVALIVLSGALSTPIAAQNPKLTVAAGADLQPALDELKASFQQRSGIELTLIYGSSGNLFTQIQNGAPYDVFMSADMAYAQRLVAQRLAEPGSLYRYAIGRLVLCRALGVTLDLNKLGMQALLDPAVKKVAVANPQHAPYGRAAVEAMKSARIYKQVAPKLVLGENARQAAQFVDSGNAQLGLLPRSLVLVHGAPDKTACWEVPIGSYPVIDQGAVVLSGSKNKTSAEQFIHYLKQGDGLMLLKKYGFVTPQSLMK